MASHQRGERRFVPAGDELLDQIVVRGGAHLGGGHQVAQMASQMVGLIARHNENSHPKGSGIPIRYCPPRWKWRTKIFFFSHACRFPGEMANDPQRRARITEAKRGKPRPSNVGQKVPETNRGRHHSLET
jgi:hypothetical protein